jgi:hypothetical protein
VRRTLALDRLDHPLGIEHPEKSQGKAAT